MSDLKKAAFIIAFLCCLAVNGHSGLNGSYYLESLDGGKFDNYNAFMIVRDNGTYSFNYRDKDESGQTYYGETCNGKYKVIRGIFKGYLVCSEDTFEQSIDIRDKAEKGVWETFYITFRQKSFGGIPLFFSMRLVKVN